LARSACEKHKKGEKKLTPYSLGERQEKKEADKSGVPPMTQRPVTEATIIEKKEEGKILEARTLPSLERLGQTGGWG